MGQRLFVTQAGEMSAHRKVTDDSRRAELKGELAKLWQERLKDKREPDDERAMPLEAFHDTIDAIADVEHFDAVATNVRRGRQIAHPEIALILIPDQRDV